MRTLTERTLHGFKWSYLSAFLQAVLRLGVLAVLAHLLEPRDFGLLGIVLIFVNIAERVGQLGVGPAVVQRQDLAESQIRIATSLSLLMGALLVLLLWLLAPALAQFFGEPVLTPLLRASSTVFLLESASTVSDSLLQRDLRFKALLVVDNLSYLIGSGFVGIALAYLGYGVWALAAALIVQRAVKTLLLLSLAPVRCAFHFPPDETRELLRLGSGFSLVRLLNYGALQGDNFVVGRVLGAGALGIYGRAYQLMTLPAIYFTQVLDRVLFPALAERQSDRKRLAEVYLHGTEGIALVGMPVSVVMYFAAPEVVSFLFGSQWEAVIPVLQILSFGVFSRMAYKMSDTLVRALGAVYPHAVRQGIYALLVVVGSLVGSTYGLAEVAFAVMIAVVTNHVQMSLLAMKLVGTDRMSFLRAHLPAAWVSLLLTPVLFLLLAVLRSAETTPFLCLCAVGPVGGLTAVAALILAPKMCKLSSSRWLLQRVSFQRYGLIGKWIKILLPRLSNP